VRQFAERQAINTPLQGSSADMIKMSMVKVAELLKDSGLKAKMIITVHDELVFDVDKKDLKKTAELVKDAMENIIKLSVSLDVNVKAGDNWVEMEDVVVA
jgi:DNA polymerase I